MRNLTAQPGKSGDIALLGALCLFLSALDHLIPKPLPFMRIGLANLPLLIALNIFSVKQFFLLVLVKVLGQSLITGTLFSYVVLFSLTGTLLSAVTMRLLYPSASLVGTSIAGAFVSNAAQLVLARFVVFGEGVLYLAPPFLAAGIVSGGLLGFFAQAFSAQSEWLKRKSNGKTFSQRHGNLITDLDDDIDRIKPVANDDKTAGRRLWSFILLALGAVFLIVPQLPVRAALFVFFWFLVIVTGKKTNPVITIVSIAAIMICNLFPPFGKILFRIGPLIIAEGSILRGFQRAVTMEGLIMFSKLFSVPLPGKIGGLLQESFGILERMNNFFAAEKKSPRTIMQKLDGVLCKIDNLPNTNT